MGAKQVPCFVTLQGWQQGFKCRGGAVERNSTTTNGFAPLPTSRTQTLYVVWSEDIISSFCMYFISLSRRFLNILFIETYSFLFNYRYQLVFPYNWRETIQTWLWITTEDYSILKAYFQDSLSDQVLLLYSTFACLFPCYIWLRGLLPYHIFRRGCSSFLI